MPETALRENSFVLSTPQEDVADTSFAPHPEIWAANGIDLALSCIEPVQRTLVRAAQWFHEEKSASAYRLFAQCMEGLERFTETMLITRNVLKFTADTVAVEGFTLGKIETQMENILRSILECQEKNDMVGIADRIEYALIPNLSLWSQTLRQLKRSQASHA